MKSPIFWFFPLALALLILCGTVLYPPLFNDASRWALITLAFLLAISSRHCRMVVRLNLFVWLIIYILWCLFTVSWSAMPILSLYKVGALFFVAVGLFSLGFGWFTINGSLQKIPYAFAWLLVIALITSLSGKAGQGLMEQGEFFYSGATGNSNYLGWMVVIPAPLLLWVIADKNKQRYQRIASFFLLGVCSYYLLLSQSRGSMLLAMFILMGFFLSSPVAGRIKIVSAGVVLIVVGFSLHHDTFDLLYQKFVLKGRGENVAMSFELSRQHILELSYQAAMQGGYSGGGYGVSIGSDESQYSGGLTSVGYGREKGSSILAVIEETGWIGLGILVVFFYKLFACGFRAYSVNRVKETRLLIGTLTGLIVGLLVYSNIEAWWVSPGSAPSMFFWGISGMYYGLLVHVLRKSA